MWIPKAWRLTTWLIPSSRKFVKNGLAAERSLRRSTDRPGQRSMGRVGTTAVLVISGPIASGKSSAANAMATQVRSAGRTAAVVDLDRLYMMLDNASHMDDDSVWRLARRAAAALTDQFVADGIDTVIVEGTF